MNGGYIKKKEANFTEIGLLLLEEMLQKGVSQRQAADQNGISVGTFAKKITHGMRMLLVFPGLDAKSIIGSGSMYLRDVVNHKEGWLRAISAYRNYVDPPAPEIELDNRKVSELTVSELIAIIKAARI